LPWEEVFLGAARRSIARLKPSMSIRERMPRRANQKDQKRMSSKPRWSALQLKPQGGDGATLAMMINDSHASLPGSFGYDGAFPRSRQGSRQEARTDRRQGLLPGSRPSEIHAVQPAGTQYSIRHQAKRMNRNGALDTQYWAHFGFAYGNSKQKPYAKRFISAHLRKCFQDANEG